MPGLEFPSDIKFVLIYTFLLYLYFRKKHISYLKISAGGYISLFLSIAFDLHKGIKALAMISGIVVGFILSYKELAELEKNNISAKEYLNLNFIDIIVLATFAGIWMIIKSM